MVNKNNMLSVTAKLRTKGSWDRILPGAPKTAINIRAYELTLVGSFSFFIPMALRYPDQSVRGPGVARSLPAFPCVVRTRTSPDGLEFVIANARTAGDERSGVER